jgi:hypothetical protein
MEIFALILRYVKQHDMGPVSVSQLGFHPIHCRMSLAVALFVKKKMKNYDPLPKSNYMPILGRWWLWVHVQPTSGPDFPPVLSIDFKNFAKTSPKISDLSDCSTIFLRFSPPHLQWQRLAPVFPKQLRLHRPRAPWRGQIRTQHRDFFPVFPRELMRNSRGNHWKPWEMTVQTTVSTCFSRADFRNESNLIFLGLGEIRDN